MWPMQAQPHARKPAPALAARAFWLRHRIGVDAFGSALGDSVVGAIRQADFERQHPVVSADEKQQILAGFAGGPGGESSADEGPRPSASRDGRGMTFSENAKYRGALRSQGIDPDAPVTDAPVTQGIQGKYVKVKSGDTVSGLMRGSSPQAVGAFLAGNDMTNSNLRVGQLVFVAYDVGSFGSQARLGQSTLNSDNRRLALAAEAGAQQSTAFQQAQSCSSVAACKEMSTQFARQAQTFGQAAAYYRERGNMAISNEYMKAAIDAGLAAGAASDVVRAAVPRVNYSAAPASIPANPFHVNWNTGDKAAGLQEGGLPSPKYVVVNGGSLGLVGGGAMNLDSGDLYVGGGGSVPVTPGASIVYGFIFGNGSSRNLPQRVKNTNEFISGSGFSAGVSLFNFYVGLNHSYGGATAIEVGLSTPGGGMRLGRPSAGAGTGASGSLSLGPIPGDGRYKK